MFPRAGAVGELIQYSGYHFETEEGYMVQCDYPGYKKHKEEHGKFIKKILEFHKRLAGEEEELSLDVLEFLWEWINDHILKCDKKYGKFFNEKGLF